MSALISAERSSRWRRSLSILAPRSRSSFATASRSFFAANESGAEISSALEQTRDMIGAKARVPTPARRRLRGTEAPVWFASLRAASRSERRAREDREFAALRSISDVAHEATRAGAEPIENHDRRTLIKGDHIIGVKTRFPVAWAAPKRSCL